MDSALTIGFPSVRPRPPASLSSSTTFLQSSTPPQLLHRYVIKVKATSSSNSPAQNPILRTLKNTAAAAALILAATAAAGKLRHLPARAEPLSTTAEEDEKPTLEDETNKDSLSQFLESNSEALKSLLQQKLESGEDEEALKILKNLISATPPEQQSDWSFLMARLLSEMGRIQEARRVFDEILERNPLSFEALFENALLMDRCGERGSVMFRLEEALKVAEDENKAKEARDVRLIMAQMQFLHKNVDEALLSYDALAREDPDDFRPYFCKGMIYSLLDKNDKAKEEFAKYRKLSPKKFEVQGYLRTPLSRMKLFGTHEEGN